MGASSKEPAPTSIQGVYSHRTSFWLCLEFLGRHGRKPRLRLRREGSLTANKIVPCDAFAKSEQTRLRKYYSVAGFAPSSAHARAAATTDSMPSKAIRLRHLLPEPASNTFHGGMARGSSTAAASCSAECDVGRKTPISKKNDQNPSATARLGLRHGRVSPRVPALKAKRSEVKAREAQAERCGPDY